MWAQSSPQAQRPPARSCAHRQDPVYFSWLQGAPGTPTFTCHKHFQSSRGAFPSFAFSLMDEPLRCHPSQAVPHPKPPAGGQNPPALALHCSEAPDLLQGQERSSHITKQLRKRIRRTCFSFTGASCVFMALLMLMACGRRRDGQSAANLGATPSPTRIPPSQRAGCAASWEQPKPPGALWDYSEFNTMFVISKPFVTRKPRLFCP